MDIIEIAWAGGFMEGEGSIGAQRRASGHVNLIAQAAQADPEPLERLRAALGCGRIYGPYKQSRSGIRSVQDRYAWMVYDFESVQHVTVLLWPFLGSRKRLVIADAFRCYHARTAALGGNRRSRRIIKA